MFELKLIAIVFSNILFAHRILTAVDAFDVIRIFHQNEFQGFHAFGTLTEAAAEIVTVSTSNHRPILDSIEIL